MQHIVVFTGAGISAESGLKTFRDMGGLWEQYRIEDVATPEAFARNPQMVLDFYNMRVAQLQTAQPNAGHKALVELESKFKVQIITQNVDDLHERAGSSQVLHLHGELTKCRSVDSEMEIFPMPESGLKWGDCCPRGSQLRPHIVWFGEMVPAMDAAERMVREADLLLVVGTSLNVYPAAGLVYVVRPGCNIILVDPGDFPDFSGITHLKGTATEKLPDLVHSLLEKNEHV